MSTIEQELIEKISRLSSKQRQQVLAYVQSLEASPHHYSARELLKLPREERERLVVEAFTLAADEEFETFEAYSEEEIDAS